MGTLALAELHPKFPDKDFPQQELRPGPTKGASLKNPSMNVAKRRSKENDSFRPASKLVESEDFLDSEIDDQDLVAAAEVISDWQRIEDIEARQEQNTTTGTDSASAEVPSSWKPRKLENGKWACKHPCKDKTL